MMILEILSILILAIPLAWELWDDRNGDDHSKNDDWILRGLLMIVCSIAVWFINSHHNFLQALFLSFAMFTALFPYLINIILYKRGVISNLKWWDHLSNKAIPDKWISFIPWQIRMVMYLIILGAAVKLYICWGALTSWDGCK